jgi:hypothetical protein
MDLLPFDAHNVEVAREIAFLASGDLRKAPQCHRAPVLPDGSSNFRFFEKSVLEQQAQAL